MHFAVERNETIVQLHELPSSSKRLDELVCDLTRQPSKLAFKALVQADLVREGTDEVRSVLHNLDSLRNGRGRTHLRCSHNAVVNCNRVA